VYEAITPPANGGRLTGDDLNPEPITDHRWIWPSVLARQLFFFLKTPGTQKKVNERSQVFAVQVRESSTAISSWERLINRVSPILFECSEEKL